MKFWLVGIFALLAATTAAPHAMKRNSDSDVLGAIAQGFWDIHAEGMVEFLDALPLKEVVLAAWGQEGVDHVEGAIQAALDEFDIVLPAGMDLWDAGETVPLMEFMESDSAVQVAHAILGANYDEGDVSDFLEKIGMSTVMDTLTEVLGTSEEDIIEDIMDGKYSKYFGEEDEMFHAIVDKYWSIGASDMVAFLDELDLKTLLIAAWGDEGFAYYMSLVRPYFPQGTSDVDILAYFKTSDIYEALGTDDDDLIMEYIFEKPFATPYMLFRVLSGIPIDDVIEAIANVQGQTPDEFIAEMSENSAESSEEDTKAMNTRGQMKLLKKKLTAQKKESSTGATRSQMKLLEKKSAQKKESSTVLQTKELLKALKGKLDAQKKSVKAKQVEIPLTSIGKDLQLLRRLLNTM